MRQVQVLKNFCLAIALGTLGLGGVLSTEAYASQEASLDGASGQYLLGTGIYDITGPAAEVAMMGFVDGKQITSGIHTRLRSRAFIIGDEAKRVVFVTADLGMMFQMVKLKVSEKVAADPELSPHYNAKNIALTATHTHGGPGGYSGYFLYDAPIKGFVRSHFNAIVEGIYQSIKRAHKNLKPGHIKLAESSLEGVGGNRGKPAYENNPLSERQRYDSDTDKTFTQLNFFGEDGEELGLLNWFAVHPTSIGPGNTLITGDNKGIAAYMIERDKGTNYFAEKTFVAGFAQANEGDVTPNFGFEIAQPEVELAANRSLANSVKKQYEKAKELYETADERVSGSIDFRHQWVDMRELYVEAAGKKTCAAGMGASFSSGSPLDNPSPAPLFPMGTTVDSLTWEENQDSAELSKLLGGVFSVIWWQSGSPEYKACHEAKPVLIPTGVANLNFGGPNMTPQIVPLQVLKVGSLAIVAVPAEVTTMAGRRFREAVVSELAPMGVRHGVVSSLANTYTSYLATKEEYALQWYEGAGTQFGPNEELGFRQEFKRLARALRDGKQLPEGPTPPDVTKGAVDFTNKVVLDAAPLGKSFGAVHTQPNPGYFKGQVVSAKFWGAHPNNNYRIQDSFLVVEVLKDGVWLPYTFDGDPQTTFRWERNGIAQSIVTITWDTTDVPSGRYRIRHKGDAKTAFKGMQAYEGVTVPFEVDERQ